MFLGGFIYFGTLYCKRVRISLRQVGLDMLVFASWFVWQAKSHMQTYLNPGFYIL